MAIMHWRREKGTAGAVPLLAKACELPATHYDLLGTGCQVHRCRCGYFVRFTQALVCSQARHSRGGFALAGSSVMVKGSTVCCTCSTCIGTRVKSSPWPG